MYQIAGQTAVSEYDRLWSRNHAKKFYVPFLGVQGKRNNPPTT